ncbi:MAG: spore germination protein [Clostridiales bacterium]|nr:spore germination protein [Clostridiales bacterium]
MIKKKTDLGFMLFVRRATPSFGIFVSAFYAMYFVYAANYFLISYTDIFLQRLNPDTDIYIIAALLLAVCVYAASKGASAVTRCGIFIFAFALIAFLLIFCGNISNLDFRAASLDFDFDFSDFSGAINIPAIFFALALFSVMFSCVSDKVKSFKMRHLIFFVTGAAVLFSLSVFFLCFSLGDYGKLQSFQMFTLAKSAKLGVMNGLDGFFLAVITSSFFLLVSMILISINRTFDTRAGLKMILIFAVIIYVLFVCAGNSYSVKEILTNPLVFGALSVSASVIIPCAYILIFRRRLNA